MREDSLKTKNRKDLSFYRQKKVLVTGGAGFIGSYLIPLLLELGAKVIVADNLSRGNLKYLKPNLDRISFYKTDLTSFSNCVKVIKGCDIVFNLAAKNTGIEYDPGHEHEMFTENMLLQLMPLKAAASSNCSYFLQVSSAVVYPRKDGVIYEEDVSNVPEISKSGYAYAKLMGEKAATWYAKNTHLQIAIARPNNAYGPRDESAITTLHVIPALANKILRGDNPVVMYGSGKQKRTFTHARDFALGLLYVLAKSASRNPFPINISSDDELIIDDVFQNICDALDKHPKVIHDQNKPEGPLRRYPDNTRLKKLGWDQTVPFKEGIYETALYIKKHFRNEG